MTKLIIFGMDCMTPQLTFDAWLDDLPNLKALCQKGVYARLRSTIPPITVPAWTAMMTSKDPGQLGFYGFRNRKSYDYEALYFANAKYVKEKTVWNYLSRNRLRSLILGVPQTYPPKPLNGVMVASFLTPDKSVQYTYPDEIKHALDRAAEDDYIIDVKNFRTDNKEKLLDDIIVMTRRRFMALRYLLANDSFDFAMMVEMGPDRIHHGFWRYMDKNHRLYEPGNPYESVIHDYYVLLDQEIGKTLKVLGDDCNVMVVSDHGAKTMIGAICINEWLIKKGYLTLKEEPAEPTRLKMEMIDWSKTYAWGEGGYYSRIFFNVQEREPQGIIPQAEYEEFRARIIADLEAMTDEHGNRINTKALIPEQIYRECKRIPPDLVVYLGNLDWRSAATVGNGKIWMYENDTGPDDANHAEDGIFITDMPKERFAQVKETFSIYDIAPTVLTYFGIDVPEDMIGRSIIKN